MRMQTLTCPLPQVVRGHEPSVAQNPHPEAGQQPVHEAQRQPGRGQSTEPEQRRLSGPNHGFSAERHPCTRLVTARSEPLNFFVSTCIKCSKSKNVPLLFLPDFRFGVQLLVIGPFSSSSSLVHFTITLQQIGTLLPPSVDHERVQTNKSQENIPNSGFTVNKTKI